MRASNINPPLLLASKASSASNASIASTASKASKVSKALIITYYWPPSGGAGVQRWLKFAKYLPEFGWEPVILTVDPEFAAYPVTDSSLTQEIPLALKIHKTGATDYFSIYKKDKSKIPTAGFANSIDNSLKGKLLRFIRGNFFLPDPRKGWNSFAFKKACELIESEGISSIITTSPPHSTQLIGLKLKKKYPQINWIADIRDPWTDIYYYDLFYPTFISKAIDSRYEKSVLKNADSIITVGKSLLDSFIAKGNNIRNKTVIIPNGYDEEDFTGLNPDRPEKFTISYTGTLSDIYPINGFLDALENLRSEGKVFLLRFVGTVSSVQQALIIAKAGKENVEFIPYVDHRSAIKYMFESSLLLLIIPDHKSNKSIITGKIFEYLATGRPVLCLGPEDGDAASILNESGHGKTVSYGDSVSILNFIESAIAGNYLSGKVKSGAYSRKNLTGKLSSLLENQRRVNCGVVVDNDLDNDIRVLREINILNKAGYSINALCFAFNKVYDDSLSPINITRIKITKKIKDTLFFFLNTLPAYEWLWAIKISKLIARNNLEVLHVHDLYMAKAAYWGIKKSGRSIPLILDLHENYPFTVTTYNWTKGVLRSMFSRPVAWGRKEREYLGYADRIIVLSDDYLTSLITRYPELTEEIFTILPNVPDLTHQVNKNAESAVNPFNNDFPVIFYYGVIAERRGVFDALEVFTELVKDKCNVNFLLIGPVDKKDKVLFMNTVGNELLAGRIHYIPWINSAALPAWLEIVDICIAPFHKNPQHESGVANKIYEYMMGAKPLVVSNCLPQQNLIEKHKCGIVFENMSGFKEALKKLADDKHLRTELGKNGSEAIKNFYNTAKVEESLIKLYKTIL